MVFIEETNEGNLKLEARVVKEEGIQPTLDFILSFDQPMGQIVYLEPVQIKNLIAVLEKASELQANAITRSTLEEIQDPVGKCSRGQPIHL